MITIERVESFVSEVIGAALSLLKFCCDIESVTITLLAYSSVGCWFERGLDIGINNLFMDWPGTGVNGTNGAALSLLKFCCDGYGIILSGTDWGGNYFTKTYPICGGSILNGMMGGYFLAFDHSIYDIHVVFGCALSYI